MNHAPAHLRPMLVTLARLYAASTAGTRGGSRDFLVERETFLRAADAADGDARELAEVFLDGIGNWSAGTIVADRHARTGEVESIRVRLLGGEEWLFAALGQAGPAAKRGELADWFRRISANAPDSVPADRWKSEFVRLADAAQSGASVQPFLRDDQTANDRLLHALTGVLNWRGESLIRYASAVICGDSKSLQTLTPRLTPLLEVLAGRAQLEDFGILSKPRMVAIHGPLLLECGGHRHDFTGFPGATQLSETTLQQAAVVHSDAPCCLTVENEDVFLELCKLRTGILLVHTSYPGAATRTLLRRLPSSLPRYHFGDTDPAGFDILRDLREKSSVPVAPLLMEPDFSVPDGNHACRYTAQEQQLLERLADSAVMADLAATLRRMLGHGWKHRFEQELLPPGQVGAALRLLADCRNARTEPGFDARMPQD
jgi:hypothetical protein